MKIQPAATIQITTERALYLTEEEALALLEICLLTELESDPIRESAMKRLGELCREFIRAEAGTDEPVEPGGAAEVGSHRGAWESLLRRREAVAPACG